MSIPIIFVPSHAYLHFCFRQSILPNRDIGSHSILAIVQQDDPITHGKKVSQSVSQSSDSEKKKKKKKKKRKKEKKNKINKN